MDRLHIFSVVHDAHTFTGMYRFQIDSITVKFANEQVTAALNGIDPHQAAERLLVELIEKIKTEKSAAAQ